MRKIMCNMISLYQRYLSPCLPPHCRYEPSCSHYMLQAIELHGVSRGLKLGIARLMRCHPFATSGYDPVPVSDNGLSQITCKHHQEKKSVERHCG